MDDSIGIDVSKDRLDAFRLSDGQYKSFNNNLVGFRALRRWVGTRAIRVVYEATGPYHGAFERAFSGDLALVKVNPLQARRFAQARGSRTKTDAVDARMLALMGDAFALQPDRPVDAKQHELKELQIERNALIKDRTRLLNRIKTQTMGVTKRHTKARIALVKRQLGAIDAEIEARLREHKSKQLDILTSIPGIGPITAATMLIECPEIGTLGHKQIAALAGLAPMTRQSGQWRGKAFIQGGRKFLRDALYMPALVATRFNEEMKQKYQSLKAAGKPSKLAITVIMRKLIELANTLIKQDRKWMPKTA